MTPSRRSLLAALSTGILTTATGCTGILTSDSTTRTTDTEETDTPIYPTTAVPGTTRSGTTTQNNTSTQSNTTQPPTTTQVVQGPTAGEVYQNVLENNSIDLALDEDENYSEQVEEAAIKGAQEGQILYKKNGEYLRGDTHLTSMNGVTQVDEFNFEEGDIAAPHFVYSAGQTPMVLIEYTNPETGERESNSILPFGPETNENDYTSNFPENSSFWDAGPADSHVLDASIFESSFENVSPEEYTDENKEQFSALPYNAHNISTGITIGSWDAWYKAEEKVTNCNAKEVFDDLTELANDPRIDNFAFGYDEETDSFTAQETMSDSEYQEMNPFQYLEWPRE